MRILNLTAVVAASLILGACAATPRTNYKTDIYLSPGVTKIVMDEGKVDLKDARVDCAMIKPDATLIPVTYCRTVAEARITREKTQKMLFLQISRAHMAR